MADRAGGLRAAAARKRDQALRRARAAIRELDSRGERVTFQSVAREAGVSRQWLYEQPDLRPEIERLRELTDNRRARLPSTDRATVASLKQRLATLSAENRELREENRNLRAELALAYGEQRRIIAPVP
jgi:Family of unknown function (DUF6262)